MKESILHVILLLQEIHGAAALSACPGLCSKICSLLGDSQAAVRTAAVEAVIRLHGCFGSSLWVRAEPPACLLACDLKRCAKQASLEAAEVRAPVVKVIRDGIAAAPQKGDSALASTFRSLAAATSSGRRYAADSDSCCSEVDDELASLARSGTVRASVQKRAASASAGTGTGTGTARSATDAARQSSSVFPQHLLGSTSPASFSTTSSHSSDCASAAASAFHPASYLPFLDIPASSGASSAARKGGAAALVDEKAVRAVSNDAEMVRYFRGISAALDCPDDWQARIAALVALQRLAWGYSRDCLAPALQSAGSFAWKAPLVEVSVLVQHIKEICGQVLRPEN